MPARLRLFRIASSMWFHGSAPYTATETVRSPSRGHVVEGGDAWKTSLRAVGTKVVSAVLSRLAASVRGGSFHAFQ
jgi:hypothetical protein